MSSVVDPEIQAWPNCTCIVDFIKHSPCKAIVMVIGSDAVSKHRYLNVSVFPEVRMGYFMLG